MDADFARLGAEHRSAHADEVADVEQLLEDNIIISPLYGPRGGFITLLTGLGGNCSPLGGGGGGLQVVSGDVDLNAALGVLKLHERCLAHHAAAHHTAGDGNLAGGGFVAEFG